MPAGKPWTAEELAIMENNAHLGPSKIAKLLSVRTYDAVKNKFSKLGLEMATDPSKPFSHSIWLEAELQFLIDNADESNEYVAKRLGRSISAVNVKRMELKLTGNKRKLSQNDADEIRRKHAHGERIVHLAKEYNVSYSFLSRIIKGKAWT